MASMLQYHPKRRVSATGKIVVSADPKTALVGKTISKEIFDLNNKKYSGKKTLPEAKVIIG